MKNLWFFTTIVLVSCTYSPVYIEQMAKKTVVFSDLNILLDDYVSSYYQMPYSLTDLAQFYQSNADNSDEAEHFRSRLSYLNADYLYMSSYSDSCFIFDAKNRIGCCYYDLPQNYLNAPWYSGFSLFRPSVISKDGKILKEYDGRIMTNLRHIWEKYPIEFFVNVHHKKSLIDRDISRDIESDYFIPYRRLFSYSPRTGLLDCPSRSPDSLSFFRINLISNKREQLRYDEVVLSPTLKQELEFYMDSLIKSDCRIDRILFFSYLRTNE